jgi:hydrogenase nickel incorporation protein HypA/HybF
LFHPWLNGLLFVVLAGKAGRMHELGIAQEIVALASERAEGARVRRVVLEVGKLAAVLPDALRFCFDLCAEGSDLEGADLFIIETPGLARCRACGGDVQLDRPFGRCACGETDLEWLSGEELRIKEIEVADV